MFSDEGRSFARCSRIFRANLRHFYPREFCPWFQEVDGPEGGDGFEVEFRSLGGGFLRFKEVGDGLEVSKWLA